MASRLELHEILCELVNITESNGDRHIYFNPPTSLKMRYPAIRYSLKDIDVLYANNSAYKQDKAYEMVLITSDPDSDLVGEILKLPKCSFDRFYRADNLNHFVFTIYH